MAQVLVCCVVAGCVQGWHEAGEETGVAEESGVSSAGAHCACHGGKKSSIAGDRDSGVIRV